MNIKKAAEMFDLNWIFLAKSLRNAGLSIESLIEFAQFAQLRKTENVEFAQKQILADQLEELDAKLAEMQEVRDLLVYKIDTYDDHIAKFKSGEISTDKVEKIWERKK